MSRKFKVIASVLIAVLLLTFGGTAVAMAQDETETEQPQAASGFVARIAEILGIPAEKLVEAFEQARQELRDEDAATGNGTLRQERRQLQECWGEDWQDCEGQGELKQYQNRWTERRHGAEEKRLAAGNRFQGNRGGIRGNGQLPFSGTASGQQVLVPAQVDALPSGTVIY